ncbi:cytochrome c551/cytochrome c550 [Salinibacillus kushneri]|uniref:Cytochrome c551/cytochrome c550 n=1 Tax=Salinibacillus kushneri TaxID=237682 RepID=A0A1I0FYS6_9BACI|nr:cytochrome c [Salinibacillus kushneri]SET63441.1 cytochrome c551/cytochrome c550 [Salinibacillus kushneri]
MKKNPVIPFAIIAVLGIVGMIILSGVGVNQMDEVRGEGENGGTEEQSEGGETVDADPESIFQNTCSSCHGADLAGTGAAPSLQEVGSKYSASEIEDIINNGKEGGMPAGLVEPEQATKIAEWLAEKK